MARILSVQAGGLKTVPGPRGPYETAIDKRPLAGRVPLGPGGVPGDAVGDPRHHGGPDQAVLCFAAAHYAALGARVGRPLDPGAFGENLTVEGADERSVRLGDLWRAGTALLLVTAPRLPCGTLARHLGDPGLPDAIRRPHRAGWYARVVEAGEVEAGDALTLVRPGPAAWTVERAAAVHDDPADLEGARALLAVESLAPRWRATMEGRLSSPPPGPPR